MATKDFRFELKAVNEDGTFEGYLSVFDVVDLGGDLVEKGAFTKTIKEAEGGFVPMLWQHDSSKPIGKLFLSEDEYGLKVKGELTLAVSQAQEAYALLKAGVIRGLSIGYKAIRKQMEKGVRHLKEVKLFEGSVVTFPMLPIAQIDLGSVKGADERKDFIEELSRAQTYMMRDLMTRSLCYALDEAVYSYSSETDAATILQESQDSIDQFSSAYMEHLPKLLEMWGIKGVPAGDAKAGRRISSTTRSQIEEAITKLQALLQEEASTSSEEDAADPEKQAPPPQHSSTPDRDIHLVLNSLDKFTLKGVPTWN